MTLAYANRCAERIMTWLTPHCDRIQAAGSIRRGRPTVNDIDMVAVPKTWQTYDLLGDKLTEGNSTAFEIQRRCLAEGWTIIKSGDQFISWSARGLQVDLWFCTQLTWGTVLLCRTGSKEHNIWLAQQALARGGHWNPHHGLFLRGEMVTATEAAIYAALGLEYIEPSQREHWSLTHA